MSTYKRIDGDYNIISIDPSIGDNVNVTTHTVNITGNLDVKGNVTYINTEELTVEDPFITVAGNNTGNLSTADFQEQGLVAKTSSATFAGLRFNNASLEWEISPNVDADGGPLTAYQAIGTSAAGSPGQPLNSVQFNSANTFGGSSNLTFDSAVLYHKQSSGVGGSGVYVSTSSKDVELIDKQAALVYSIIF